MIRIRVAYADFDDFWASSSLPVGPCGQGAGGPLHDQIDGMKAHLRDQLRIDTEVSITYEAFANAVKGRVQARASLLHEPLGLID